MTTIATNYDLTSQTVEQLSRQFDIEVSNSHVLFWEKSVSGQRPADISLPTILFREDVLETLAHSYGKRISVATV